MIKLFDKFKNIKKRQTIC